MEEIGIEDYVIEKIVTKGDKESAKGRTQFDKLNFVQDIEEKNLLWRYRHCCTLCKRSASYRE